ncbi:MAG: ABC transporter permease [Actinobacteria bacterium]|nr:ABC transporter permease [Actinomycetota bacterium]
MSSATAETKVARPARPRRHRWEMLRAPEGVIGLVLLTFTVAVAVIGPIVAPHPLAQPVGPPGEPPGHGFPLGTDYLGRDVLSRVLYGGWPILWLSAVITLFTYVIGVLIGMVAALGRRLTDSVLMRFVDLLLAFPPLLLVLVLIASAGSSSTILIISIVLVLFPGLARIVRSATLEVSTAGYIEAAFARGERAPAVMWHEILPNIGPVILADLGVRFSFAIALVAGVNFLGLGESPPSANWALMVAENNVVITSNVWGVLAPAVMLMVLTVSINLLGDAYVRNRSKAR